MRSPPSAGESDSAQHGPRTTAALAELPSRSLLAEHASSGADDASVTLSALARLDGLPKRVQQALKQERVAVVLADGSSLPLDEAERVLASKEERRVHRSLRESIDDALQIFRQSTIYESDRAFAGDRAELQAFLVATTALRDAACDTLAVIGGEPLEDAAALARSLDLPDEHGLFGEEQTRALIAAARAAARPPIDVGRLRAPRALAGVALDTATGVAGASDGVAFAWPPALRRFERHRRTVDAGCTALAWAHGSEAGRAAALALMSPPCRRATGTGRSQAERAGRLGAACAVLRVRAAIALASAAAEEARDAVAGAFGVDPGEALLSEVAAAPWVHVDGDADATAWLRAPLRAVALREAFDETWPLRTEAWHQLATRDDEPSDPGSAARAWLQWAGEWL